MEWQQLGPDVPSGGNALTRALGRCGFLLTGWRIEGEIPNQPRMIIAVAPHTSNFDFVLTVGVIWSLGLKASYLAKRSLFRFPLGLLMTAFGGIPVDRGSGQGLVEQMRGEFESRPGLILGITPAGTRGTVRENKRGFALIAQGAGVPVRPAIVNYQTKTVRFHPLITDVSDVEHTLAAVMTAAESGAARHPG